VSLCTEWTLHKSPPGEHHLKPLYCRSWDCETCKPRRQRQLVAQAKAGEPNRFLTLTTSLEAGDTPEEAYEVLQHAWKLFCKRVKRLPGFGSFAYLWAVEATQAGQPHLHVLLRCKWIDQSLIAAWFGELARSPVVHIEAVSSVKKAASYIAKYIAKKPARFGNSKRYFASRDYELDRSEKPLARSQDPHPWQVERESMYWLIRKFIDDGWAARSAGRDRMYFVPGTWASP